MDRKPDHTTRAMKPLLLVALIMCIILTTDAVPLQARRSSSSGKKYSDTKKLEQEMKRLKERREKLLHSLRSKRTEARNVKYTIETLDNEIGTIRRDLDSTTRQLKMHQAQEAYLNTQLQKAIKDFNQYRGHHLERIVSYYKNSKSTYLEVLFNSTNFSNFISRLHYVRIIIEHDQNVLNEMKALEVRVKEHRDQVAEKARVVALNRAILVQRQDYNTDLQNRKKMALNQIQSDMRLYEQQLALLQRESNQIERALMAARNRHAYSGTFSGRFANPLCGRPIVITSPFGYRERPTAGASSSHKGIDLRVKYGDNICSAADGVVVISRYYGGYGNLVVVNHGSNVATVYGHGLRLLVSEGQRVAKGQVIMKADSTGVSTGNHLHFEVRINGVTRNPMQYLFGK